MSSATLTLIGMKNFLDYQGIDLFEQFDIPSELDKEEAINNILLNCGENELLYPDANFMINCIGLWSKKWMRTFQKWVDVLDMEYNPLENYDRQEAWSDSASSSESMSASSSEQNSLSSSENSSASASDSSYGSESQLNDISAFNATTLREDTSASAARNNNATSSSQANNLKAELDARQQHEQESRHDTRLSHHSGRVHGNIGVTTTQQMLQSELDVQRFNIYDEIAIIFMREFVLAL